MQMFWAAFFGPFHIQIKYSDTCERMYYCDIYMCEYT